MKLFVWSASLRKREIKKNQGQRLTRKKKVFYASKSLPEAVADTKVEVEASEGVIPRRSKSASVQKLVRTDFVGRQLMSQF